ncbi:MAG: hypothetical protein AAF228_06940 [Pseudomonadota bacterium]
MDNGPEDSTLRYLRKLDEKFDRMSDRIDDVFVRVNSVEMRLNSIDKNISNIYDPIGHHSQKFDRVETDIKLIKKRLDLVEV